jgi:ADP-ribosylglycohydrolase
LSDSIPLAARLAGAVWGHLVGDAVGVPYEFRSAREIGAVEFGAKGRYGQPPGTWSDDGPLMLALLDSLLTVGFDPEDQARRALDWYRRGTYTPDGDGYFDIGNATRQALDAFEGGAPAERAGSTSEQSGGNGSLMRILPLALVDSQVARTAAVSTIEVLAAHMGSGLMAAIRVVRPAPRTPGLGPSRAPRLGDSHRF